MLWPKNRRFFPNVQAQKVEHQHPGGKGRPPEPQVGEHPQKHACGQHPGDGQQLYLHPDAPQPPGQSGLKGLPVLGKGDGQSQQPGEKQHQAPPGHRHPPGVVPIGDPHHRVPDAGGQRRVQGHSNQQESPAGERAQQEEETQPGHRPPEQVAPFFLSAFPFYSQCPTPPSSIPARWD